jgi:hypothetical protein
MGVRVDVSQQWHSSIKSAFAEGALPPKIGPKKEFPRRLAVFSVLDDDDEGRPDDNFKGQRGANGEPKRGGGTGL